MEDKKILGLIGSYRKNGNSEIVAKAVARHMGREEGLELIRLPLLDIRPCKGCYACLLPGVQCTLEDDMEWLLERMRSVSAIIFVVPDYVLGPAGIMKMIADRALQAGRHRVVLEKIPVVAALTLGREDYRGYADTALISQVTALGCRVAGVSLFQGTHPGEAALAPDFSIKIEYLARCLSGEELPPRDEARCPRCFSDLFRLREGKIECSLCKAEGILDGERPVFTRFPREFSPEGQMEHIEWLLMKKKEFVEIKDRLKAVQNEYRTGEWLVPERSGTGE